MISDSFQLPGLVCFTVGFFILIVPPVLSFLLNFLATAAVSIKLVSELDATEEATRECQPAVVSADTTAGPGHTPLGCPNRRHCWSTVLEPRAFLCFSAGFNNLRFHQSMAVDLRASTMSLH